MLRPLAAANIVSRKASSLQTECPEQKSAIAMRLCGSKMLTSERNIHGGYAYRAGPKRRHVRFKSKARKPLIMHRQF